MKTKFIVTALTSACIYTHTCHFVDDAVLHWWYAQMESFRQNNVIKDRQKTFLRVNHILVRNYMLLQTANTKSR